ncbi:hypothetical protein CC1G_06143 [Coprinopsis cinerea okayama7|uniref:Uncharacterized protein n=1 Tax=Coprinopsis cinerea (strain Okayama-7 / 130 / ATCC MYA-4618 / FGSC 9003) TaxID=240176 RepID=A8PAB5_COPC7|nr:hypothetical protein CC1G_06143 [Coprinopsis cinerea okayama7\|eukprot:XP_001839953.1 hypothetical protein CC1G_06143 [Coprinopsis cinerea okayama7\
MVRLYTVTSAILFVGVALVSAQGHAGQGHAAPSSSPLSARELFQPDLYERAFDIDELDARRIHWDAKSMQTVKNVAKKVAKTALRGAGLFLGVRELSEMSDLELRDHVYDLLEIAERSVEASSDLNELAQRDLGDNEELYARIVSSPRHVFKNFAKDAVRGVMKIFRHPGSPRGFTGEDSLEIRERLQDLLDIVERDFEGTSPEVYQRAFDGSYDAVEARQLDYDLD